MPTVKDYIDGYSQGAKASFDEAELARKGPKFKSDGTPKGDYKEGLYDGMTADEGQRRAQRDGDMQRELERRLKARDAKKR